MARTQIQLTEEQHRLLKAAARQKEVSVTELVRQSVDFWLANFTAEENYTKALGVLGRFQDCASDVSEKHDEYMSEVWSR